MANKQAKAEERGPGWGGMGKEEKVPSCQVSPSPAVSHLQPHGLRRSRIPVEMSFLGGLFPHLRTLLNHFLSYFLRFYEDGGMHRAAPAPAPPGRRVLLQASTQGCTLEPVFLS